MAAIARITRTIGYTLATLIILSALLVSSTRLLTPLLNQHRADFENTVSKLIGRPVKIERIYAVWNFLHPELQFDDVTVLDPITRQPNLHIRQVNVGLKIISSLAYWQIRLETLKLTGINLTINEQAADKVHLAGVGEFSLKDNFTGQSVNPNALLGWIFTQPYLILKNININYIPLNGITKSVTVNRLRLHNSSNEHSLIGHAILNQNLPTQVDIQFEWNGSVTDIPHISAKLYLYAEAVSLPQWFQNTKFEHYQIQNGLGSAKIWADWNENTWQRIQSTFQFYDLSILNNSSQSPVNLSRLSGNLDWKRKGNSQFLSGDNILIDSPQHLWPTTHFSATYSLTDNNFNLQNLQISYLDIYDFHKLFPTDVLPVEYKNLFAELDPHGEFKNVYITSNGNLADIAHLNLTTTFNHLALRAVNNFPTIKNFDGTISWNDNQGIFQINSQKCLVDYEKLFLKPLYFDQLNGSLQFQKNPDSSWTLKGQNLQAINADINIQNDLQVITSAIASPPFINLTGKFSILDAAHFKYYLPMKMFDTALVDWLNHAFVKGEIKEGAVVLQGPLNYFPFEQPNAGKFYISGVLNNIDLNYAQGWPILKNIQGRLTFAGNTMTTDVYSAKLLDTPVQNIHASIPYIGKNAPQVLTVSGQIQTDLAQELQFIHSSPLEETIGKDLSVLKFAGPAQLKLNLVVPLGSDEKISVSGDTNFQNATLTMSDWNLQLQNLKGEFQFTQSSVNSNNITGSLFNYPVNLVLSTQTTNDIATVDANLQGTLSVAALQNWLKQPVNKLLDGTTNFTAQLQVTHKPIHKTEITLHSDLNGMEVKLPDGYGKKANEKGNLDVLLDATSSQPLRAKLAFNNLFSAALTLQKNNNVTRIYSGELRLGNQGKAEWQTTPGIVITGNLDKVNWINLQPYYVEFSAQPTTKNKSEIVSFVNLDMVRKVDILINQLNFPAITLNTIRLQLSKTKDYLQIGLNNLDLDGDIYWPLKPRQLIRANFSKITLPASSEKGISIHPNSLPEISFIGNDVKYGDVALGNLSFYIVPNKNGVAIRQLDLTSPNYRLHATGEWLENSSHLQGELTSGNLTALLQTFHFLTSSVVGTTADSQFNLFWQGTPFTPSLQGLSGRMSLKLGKGSIINLSTSTTAEMGFGKMLNIFSLQSIPRRLSGDFSDVYGKGFNFDYMKGDFTFRNGDALTDNSKMDGPIAKVEASGRIGLMAKDYDMQISVTPNVATTLPVVATLTGGPLVGLATWVVGTAVSHAVAKVTTHTYRVTGNWNNPVWTQVSGSVNPAQKQ